MSGLRPVVEILRRHDIPFALIGASALAAHGVSRSTLDIDLLTTDPRALGDSLWRDLSGVDIRRGDADDPLAGVVRIPAPAGFVDVVVGRSAWQTEIVERARPTSFEDVHIPVVDASGLILLKLFAGGPQDAWDIEQLFAAGDREALRREVETRLDLLPRTARSLWTRVSGQED